MWLDSDFRGDISTFSHHLDISHIFCVKDLCFPESYVKDPSMMLCIHCYFTDPL